MELVPNQFSSYKLTELEETLGTILAPMQEAVLRNKLADIAASKIRIKFNPDDPIGFAQDESYQRGQMDVIIWLLDSSAAMQEDVRSKESQQYP